MHGKTAAIFNNAVWHYWKHMLAASDHSIYTVGAKIHEAYSR